MQSQALIQTNHGVSYPLVGLNRVEQSELDDSSDEVPDTEESPAENSEDANQSASA